VVNAGAPVLLPWADEVASVLLTWFPGQEAGAALAAVLTGAEEPGGRLPTTWPRREEDCPVLDVTPRDGVLSYPEGILIGYRGWLARDIDPRYAFGSGLGYTTWTYSDLEASADEAVVTLTNTGARAGREVVQIYLSASGDGPIDRPRQWLAAFATVPAGPGETVTVRIPLPERAFQVWDDGWRTLPGRYTVIAAHALDDPRRTAEIDK
jgi:beta-glucosidase